MRRLVAVGAGLVLSVGMSACTGSISQQGTSSYVSPEGVELQRVAVMLVRTIDDAEGFQRGIEQILRDSLAVRYGSSAVIPAARARKALSEAGLAEAYAQMMSDYDATGVMDADRLKEITEVVGAPHLLYVSARYWESTRGLQEDYRQRMTMRGKILGNAAGDVVWGRPGRGGPARKR